MAWVSEDLLRAIAKHSSGECVTEERMVELTGFDSVSIERATLKLRKHGLLEKTAQGCHTLTEAGLAAVAAGKTLRSGPREYTATKVNKNSLRIRVWRAIRIRRKFSLPDLEVLVAQGGEKDITSNIRKYVTALCKAGYLTELPRREAGTSITSNGFKRWWLQDAKDSGPKAPVWRASKKAMWDPNTEQEVPLCG